MTTIKDIAKLAKVGTTTVSRVINKSPKVSELTKQRVEQAMKELNFVSSCWVDEASRTVKVGITEMKEEYIQRLKEFENMGPALDIFQQDLPVDE